MKLYLMRHGESMPSGLDDERALSQRGRKDIQCLGKFIAGASLQISYVFHSQKFRTKETAELILPFLLGSPPLTMTHDLDPMAPLSPLIKQLYEWDENTLLVGHMPYLGKLISFLTSGEEENNIVMLQPGCMLCMQPIIARRWCIDWFLIPQLFNINNF